jgi:hypothetical protein
MTNGWAVAVGEMFDGIEFFGPFEEFEDAEEYAIGINNASTWIVRLVDPI